jgi:hypothetical protein
MAATEREETASLAPSTPKVKKQSMKNFEIQINFI